MSDAKYSIAIEATQKIAAPFKAASKHAEQLTEQLKGQRAELRQLQKAQRDLSGLEKMKGKLGETSRALDESQRAQRSLGQEQARLKGQLVDTTAALDSARLKQQQLRDQISASAKPSEKLRAQYRMAGDQVRDLSRDQKGLERALGAADRASTKAQAKTTALTSEHRVQTAQLGKLERGLEKAGVDAKAFATEQQRIEAATEQANAALKAQKGRLEAVAGAQSKIEANRAARADLRGQVLETAALGYIAAQPLRQAVNFESSMADVKKVVNFDSDDEANKMGRDILKMSTQIPVAAEGIAEIVAAAGQSNVAKAELLGFAESAAKMSTAFEVSAADAGSTMAAWRAAMGLSQQQTLALADATNHLGDNLNAQAADIAGVLKRQGAVAMTAGLNEIQTAALSAALLTGDAGEEVAATALKNITGALMKGERGTAAQRAGWQQLGFDPSQLGRDMLTDAPDTMIRVFEALQQQPPEELSGLVSQLFGEEAKGSVMPLITNIEDLKKAFDLTSEAAKYRGSMEREFQTRSQTTANQLQLLDNSWSRLQVNLGTLMLPTLNAIVEPLAGFTDLLAAGAEDYPRIANGVMLLGTGLVALKTGMLAVRYAGLLMGQGNNKLQLGRAKLSATTGNTARNADLATRALRRMNIEMARTGAGSDYGDGRRRKKRSGRKVRGRGSRLGKVGQWADTATDLLPTGGPMLAGAGKVIKPLGLVMGGAALTSAVVDGDAKEIGATAGDMVGGLGGTLGGAAAGAALGSVVPVVGTAIGGLVGGILGGLGGGALGGWIGEGIGSWFEDEPADRLPPPEQLKKEIANQDNRQIVFSPTITMPPSTGSPEMDRRVADQIIARMRAELVPLMGGGELAVRMDASLSDRSDL